ncbi:hypothetical protein FHR71_004166 [Methylobacterium sp. RAS18]|nr:hypothetical protein [Methylobacterium sp. RAS18]
MTNKSITASDLVTALYRAILRREPDGGGLLAHTSNIENDPSASSVENLIRGFLCSDELLMSHFTHANSGAFMPRTPPPISLGSHCYTSYLLKKLSLKTSSMPFDWIFSNIPMVSHCISDKFDKFLDQKYYKPIAVADRMHAHANLCDHSYYKENYGVSYLFNHRDPTLVEDFEYYKRCVDRFNCIFQDKSNPPLFVVTFRHSDNQLQEFSKLVSTIRNERSDSKIIGFAIDQPNSLPASEKIQLCSQGIYLSIIKPLSDWLDVRFADPLDDFFLTSRLGSAFESTYGHKVGV